MAERLSRIANILLKHRPKKGEEEWPWLSDLGGRWASKKRANKFFLGCILDYQMDADVVWENVRRFVGAEEELSDPAELWDHLTTTFSEKKWLSHWGVFKLHRFPKAHERVWRIGRDVKKHYDGDARKIWKDMPPDKVYERLQAMRVGPQISRMVIGALLDTKQIEGSSDVKADLHVRRVLGRVLKNRILTAEEAIKITKKMHPDNPWLLDLPLYYTGKYYCYASDPECGDCYLHKECKFNQNS